MLRFLHIVWTIFRYRLDRFIPLEQCPLWLKLLLSPFKLFPATNNKEASARLAFEQLGPIFTKFGQVLSTRKDLLSDKLADELEKLQDQVTPFDNETARSIIESSLKQPIHEVFDDFEEKPLASASIAQVHAAKLKSGLEVVI